MAAAKTLALGTLAWVVMSAAVAADSINGGTSSFSVGFMANTGQAVNVNQYAAAPTGQGQDGGGSTGQKVVIVSASAPSPSPAASTADGGGSTGQAPSNGTAPAAAYINFGDAPYSELSTLATGNAQAWYDSPAVLHAYGHTPTSSEQAAFRQAVVQDVETTYQLSGLAGPGNPIPNFYVTNDPKVQAAHMLSVVSGVTAASNPDAIGLTDIGSNGISFIDKFTSTQNPDQLEWAIAHNISHELMHAFGVAIHPDTTGQYLDAASANWNQLIDPRFTLSHAAVQDILAAKQIYTNANGSSEYGLEVIGHPKFCNCPLCRWLRGHDHGAGAQLAGPSPVPEPTTIALWVLAGSAAVAVRARRRTS